MRIKMSASSTSSEATEVLWLDERHQFTLMEFVHLSGLSLTDLQHLVDCEALEPVAAVEPAAEMDAAKVRFSGQCLSLARTASRLRTDFDLDTNGLTLTLQLLKRIQELEAEMVHLRAQWPHFPR